MTDIVIRFSVSDVDSTRVDPHDIAEGIEDVLQVEHRAGNVPYRIAFVSAEWAS